MKKLLKLGSQGIAHHFLLALIVVGTAIGGTYYIIQSFADTLDGRIYSIGKESKIYSMNSDGSDLRHISNLDGKYFWHLTTNKSGTKLLLSDGRDLWTADTNGLNLIKITNLSGALSDIQNLQWSTDGSKIVYEANTTSTNSTLSSRSIYSMNADGSNNQKLVDTSNGDSAYYSALSPDGTKILYLHQSSSEQDSSAWRTIPTTGGASTAVSSLNQLTMSDGSKNYATGTPVWTSDPNTIIMEVGSNYENSDLGENETLMSSCAIASIKLDTGAAKQLFKYDNFGCESLTLSPNGESIGFAMFPWRPTGGSESGWSGVSGNADLYTLPTKGGRATLIEGTTGHHKMQWSAVAPLTYTLGCTVNDVPAQIANGTSLSPSVTITNTGTAPLKPTVSVTGQVVGGSTAKLKTSEVTEIAPGGTLVLYTYPSYMPTSTKAATGSVTVAGSFVYGDEQTTKFTCASKYTMAAPLTYSAACTITGVPATVKNGATLKPTVTFKNTGTGTITGVATSKMTVNPNKGSAYTYPNVSVGSLTPGKSAAKKLGGYKIAKTSKASSAKMTVVAKVANGGAVNCSSSFKIK